jgi:hypothetical protein
MRRDSSEKKRDEAENGHYEHDQLIHYVLRSGTLAEDWPHAMVNRGAG